MPELATGNSDESYLHNSSTEHITLGQGLVHSMQVQTGEHNESPCSSLDLGSPKGYEWG